MPWSITHTLDQKPKYEAMARAYHGKEYLRKKFELCDGVTNQCAIRMSIALGRCGFSLDGFPEPRRVHGTSLRKCPLDEPHIVGATELMKFLIGSFGLTEKYDGHQMKKAYESLSGRKGILYFDNLGGRKGDHIDLFDGAAIYNEIRDYRDWGHEGGGSVTDVANRGKFTRARYFERARFIQFIQLG
jgi:hypothetical protein